MNPLSWRIEHQAALVLGAILGAAIALVIGLMYHGAHNGMFGEVLLSWIGVRWAVLGALIGAGIVFNGRLLQR